MLKYVVYAHLCYDVSVHVVPHATIAKFQNHVYFESFPTVSARKLHWHCFPLMILSCKLMWPILLIYTNKRHQAVEQNTHFYENRNRF